MVVVAKMIVRFASSSQRGDESNGELAKHFFDGLRRQDSDVGFKRF